MLYLVSLALLASLKTGDAINATTAGRSPRKNRSTYSLSLNCWKANANARIITNEGRQAPTVLMNAPLMPAFL